jgi:hypothetical protein
MRHLRRGIPALLAIAGLTACGGAPDPTRAAAQTATPQPAAAPPLSPAHAPAAADTTATVSGPVAETMNSGGYTYARLQTATGDVWIAAPEFAVQKGERLTAPLEMPMPNFHSQTLKRDFPLIYFVSQVARDGQRLSAPDRTAHPAATATPPAQVERIPPAPGGISIAEVWAKRTSLAGQQVVVRGKVVKVNSGILDRNWVHLQDGSGSAADRTNDLTVTTAADVNVGDIVTMSGVLATGKDFGSGYAFGAILEKAVVK